MNRVRGFTLVEVLLATALLASGLALAFATIRAATATAERGEAMAQRNERMRAVQGFLRVRLLAARPVPWGIDEDTGLARRFIGDGTRMAFVADLPDYLGRGGPYLHRLEVTGPPGQRRIEVVFEVVQSGEVVEDPRPIPPQVLVDGLDAVEFRYRGLDADGLALGEWQPRWEVPEALPLMVEVRIRDADGEAWPPVTVALPLAGSYAIPVAGR
ncbi:MAG TPA: prepilin-type N-terminal cleavage/methylation domain-containing protein [Luteimonas sp.]|nr:prepilin-type N-terminal cleavage/methylation domain-containing protein [Luteimonas sp.]